MPNPPSWPPDVAPIGIEDLERLGISADDQLFWDGRRIEVRQRLTLSRLQQIFAATVALCAILGGLGGAVTGLNNATVFLCARGHDWLSCPHP